jgi:hypothetical protein
MMTRRQFIERTRRQIYNGQPSDDATITVNLVNKYVDDAIAFAAKTNYKEAIAIDGIGYVNNSFYTKFSGLSISPVGNFQWKMTLPQIPIGIGQNEGISTLELVDPDTGQVTRPFVPLTENQKTFYQNMRPIPNKVLYYYEGNLLYAISTLMLNEYPANVTMVSGGDSTNLDSTLNVPDDYYPVMVTYLQQQLMFERNVPQDVANDGADFIKTT